MELFHVEEIKFDMNLFFAEKCSRDYLLCLELVEIYACGILFFYVL